MKTVVSGNVENKQAMIDSVLMKCEHEEDMVHKRFAVLLNILVNMYNVDKNIISEIEDLYIEKGYIYCTTIIEQLR